MNGIINTFFDPHMGVFRADRRGISAVPRLRPSQNATDQTDSRDALKKLHELSKGIDNTDVSELGSQASVHFVSAAAPSQTAADISESAAERTTRVNNLHAIAPGRDLAKMQSSQAWQQAQQAYAQQDNINQISAKGGLVDRFV